MAARDYNIRLGSADGHYNRRRLTGCARIVVAADADAVEGA